MGAHTHTRTHCIRYKANILPFHGNFPFAHLFRVHVVKVSSVVVRVCAAEDQLSARGVFWVPENIQYCKSPFNPNFAFFHAAFCFPVSSHSFDSPQRKRETYFFFQLVSLVHKLA